MGRVGAGASGVAGGLDFGDAGFGGAEAAFSDVRFTGPESASATEGCTAGPETDAGAPLSRMAPVSQTPAHFPHAVQASQSTDM